MPSAAAFSTFVIDAPAFLFGSAQQLIRQLRPDLDEESLTYRSAVILLLGIRLGNNIDRIARVTGYARAMIARAARRLSDDGVWCGGFTDALWTMRFDEDPFWKDVGVAEGTLHRISRGHNYYVWMPTAEVWKSYEFVSPRTEAIVTTDYHPVPENRFAIPNIYEEDAGVELGVEAEVIEPLEAPWRPRVPARIEVPYSVDPALHAGGPSILDSSGPDLFPGAVWLR